MRRLLSVARKTVDSDTSLLVLGETGAGKERLARAIHGEGPRRSGPFFAVNCGALSESLLESELFGHERGAFTGATRMRRGYFELSHGGTIFLDEIGEMPLHLQVKLLRVLDDRRILRVGGEETIDVDVRVMAASNRDLEAEGRAGRFRPDLYFRLAVVTLTVPPLRERREDIPELVDACLTRIAGGRGFRPEIGPGVMEALVDYPWPGNVRELFNAVEQAALLCDGRRIGIENLPARIAGMGGTPRAPGEAVGAVAASLTSRPLIAAREAVAAAFEREYLALILTQTEGRIGEAARRAGLSARSFYEMMRRHGLNKQDFKRRPHPSLPRAV